MANPIANDRAIANLPTPEKGQKVHYAGDIPGFGVRVSAGGAKSFVLNYRVRGSGRERRFTIGAFGPWKVAAARKEAERLRKTIDLGGDPLGDIEEERRQEVEEKSRSRTVAQLCDEFERVHLPSLRPASRKFYRLALKNHIRPAIGKKRVEDVEQSDVEKIWKQLTELGQKHQANQCAILAGVLFNYAAKWGWRTRPNPAAGVEKHTLEGRERYLSPAETKKLAAAVDKLADRQAAAIIKTLLLTGARIGETLRMRWEQVDFHRGIWSKPASTTKQKKVHHLPLSAPVLTILKDIRKEQDPVGEWVFPGLGKDGHRTDLRKPWEDVLNAAGIERLRIHDLRHNFASTLAGSGFSLPLIGGALGHSRVETTSRYAHLADDPLRMAMTRAADLITAAGENEEAEVSDLEAERAKRGKA